MRRRAEVRGVSSPPNVKSTSEIQPYSTNVGAGTLAASDGSRQPSALELDIARAHGIDFAKVVRQFIA
jgi:hypothetical protein